MKLLIRVPSDGFATEPIERCPLCLSSDVKLSFLKYGDPYFTCRECETLFLAKRPTVIKIKQCYSETGDISLIPKMRQFDRNDIPERWIRYFKTIEEIRCDSGGRHLDIGCGAGECLIASKHMGWKSIGVEVGKSAADFVKDKLQLEVINKDFMEIQFDKESFGLVTINEALEHMIDPLKTIEKAVGLLKPGGVFVYSVPSIEFIGYKAFGRLWHMIHSAHLQYFSKKAVQSIAKRYGLKVSKIYSLGGGAQGSRVAMNILRTDIAWTVFSYFTMCRARLFATDKPVGWFSSQDERNKDPRMRMRQAMDNLIKRTRVLWDILGFPIHFLSKVLDRQQSVIVFCVKEGQGKSSNGLS